MFKKVCIIGCGLIGSSIARGIKKNNLATKVVSSNRSNSTNKKVIKLKIVNEASSDTKKIVKKVIGNDCGCDERKQILNKKFPYKKD